MTHVKLLYLFLLSTGSFASGSACAELDRQCRERSEENIEWMSEEISWRNTMAEWKHLVEEECESVVGDDWQMLFECPDLSGIRCVNELARRNETDLLNCTFIFCEDGKYSDQKVLRATWKKLFKAYKDILEVYKDKLRHCPRKDCKSPATATEEPRTSSYQGTTTTDNGALSSITTSQESSTTSSPLLGNTTGLSSQIELDESCYMGMKSGMIADNAITASSLYSPGHEPYRGRLDRQRTTTSKGAWGARISVIGQWLQVDFRRVQNVSGVITQGRPTDFNQFVQSFKVACGHTQNLAVVQENGVDKVFIGNTDRDGKVYNRFAEVLACRFIRIYPQSWNTWISMRVEFVYGACYDRLPPFTAHMNNA